MAPRDPTADTEPDFGSDCWNPTREVMVNQELSTERAIEILRQSWRAQRQKDIEVWNEHLQQLQPEEDRRQRDRDNPTGSIADEESEWLPTLGLLDNQPACHVLKKLEKKEYVELWHFTAKGCQDTVLIDAATPDDTFGLANTEKDLMLPTVGTASASQKPVRDQFLSWDQLSEGQQRLLKCMKACRWKDAEVKELAKFFAKLDLHPIRSQEYGLQAVLRY